MASRPRPSLLALFDPLTLSEESPVTPTRDSFSPSPSAESGSDKENLISTTPKNTSAGSYIGKGSVKYTSSSVETSSAQADRSQAESLCESFLLGSKDDDTSNLCLVQLADELENACKLTEDAVLRGEGPRDPLSEISLVQTGSNNRTPQSVARDRNKRLIMADSPTTTPKSMQKLAYGLGIYEPSSTPPISSPLAPRRSVRTPRSRLSPKVTNPFFTLHTPANNADSELAAYPIPSLPFSSHSPSLMSSTPAGDPSPSFQDLPSSSFEMNSSLCMKKIDLSGDLLNDDISFLARMDEDSLVELSRSNSSDRTPGSSPITPQETSNDKAPFRKHSFPEKACADPLEGIKPSIRAVTPSREASTVFRRSSLYSGLKCEADRNEPLGTLTLCGVSQPHTPSSSPFSPENVIGDRSLAPKKTHAVLRRSNTLSRSTGINISEKAKEQFELGLDASQLGNPLRSRPSSTEIRPLGRSLLLAVSKVTGDDEDAGVLPISARRPSISRPSIGRRASVGHVLFSGKATASGHATSKDQSQKPLPASVSQSTRRLSVSASTKPTPIKANNFATTGRLGGARRVPLTANAPLFKTRESTIIEVQSPTSRASSPIKSVRSGPRCPSLAPGTSATLGRSSSGSALAPLNRAPPSSASTRTFGRTTSASSGLFEKPRSSFMTSSGPLKSVLNPNSRLPTPQTKAGTACRIPGPGLRKPF